MSVSITPMILAAGHATRLRPLTDRRAKAVVPFLNRPLLDYTLAWLRRHGFTRVVINLHHAAASIRDTYGTRAFGLALEYSEEPVLLGTAGGPRRALERLDEWALLVNGDVVARFGLGRLRAAAQEGSYGAVLALYGGAAARGYPLCRGDGGRLVGFPGDGVEGTVAGVFTGVHLVRRELLETVPAGVFCGIVDPLYRACLREGVPLAAVPVGGLWYEAGDPDRYIDHQLDCLAGERLAFALRGKRRVMEGGWADPHAHLENVRPEPPFLLGAGVRIKHGARVRASVLGDRARVGPGAVVCESILWHGAIVGPECRLRRVVVMDGVRVPGGTVASGVVFTPEGARPWRRAGSPA